MMNLPYIGVFATLTSRVGLATLSSGGFTLDTSSSGS